MNNKKSTGRGIIPALRPGEIYGMNVITDYKRYFAFGTDHKELFKQIVQMYNSYSGQKNTFMTFKKVCKANDYYVGLFKFNINEAFSFDDDCYGLGERGGKKIGDYLELKEKKEDHNK